MGLLLHLWIMIVMTIPVFGILMVTTYISLFSEEEFDSALDWLRRKFGGTKLWVTLARIPATLASTRITARLAGRTGP